MSEPIADISLKDHSSAAESEIANQTLDNPVVDDLKASSEGQDAGTSHTGADNNNNSNILKFEASKEIRETSPQGRYVKVNTCFI